MRLHELTPEQLDEWQLTRLEAGRAKYGDAHMQRYTLVDVMEELLDASNILDLMLDRFKEVYPDAMETAHFTEYMGIHRDIERAINALLVLDELLPDSMCTDERGGDRVWWDKQRKDDAHGQGE